MDLRYLSMSQLAVVTGKDRRTVKSKLEGLKPYRIDGKAHLYDAQLVIPRIIGFDDPDNSKNTEKQLREQELRLERAKAEKLEIELQKLRAEVVPIEEVAKTVEKEFTYVRSTLLSIPSKRAKVLALETDPAKIKNFLEEDINEALSHLQADESYKSTNEVVEESNDTDLVD